MVVGTARDLVLSPRSHSGGSLVVFRLSPDGGKLEHVHTVRSLLDSYLYTLTSSSISSLDSIG